MTNEAIHIREFQAADAAAAVHVVAQAVQQMHYSDAARDYIAKLYSLESLQRFMRDDNVTTRVAERGSCVMGIGHYRPRHIFGMYVLPTSQRQGIGTCLLRALESESEDVNAIVIEANYDAIPFYKACGYGCPVKRLFVRDDVRFEYWEMTKQVFRGEEHV